MAKVTSFSDLYDIPLVIDLHWNTVVAHVRHPPPPPRVTHVESILPIPFGAQWMPGMQILMRATRHARETRETTQTPPVPSPVRAGREGRVPGGFEEASDGL